MTKEEIVELYNIEEPVVFFEPSEIFNKGILGITEDHKHLIYGYYALATALAEDYEKEWDESDHSDCDDESCKPDFLSDAFEWLDYNTVPMCYQNMENLPIIMMELIHEEQ